MTSSTTVAKRSRKVLHSLIQLLKSDRRALLAAICSNVIGLACWLRLSLKWWDLCSTWSRRNFLRISSPLYGATQKQASPASTNDKLSCNSMQIPDSWSGFCPCCKRPIDAELCCSGSKPRTYPDAKDRYAYVITIWGSSIEYVLGAMVLGHSLKKTGSRHARVCLYANDVPPDSVALLSQVWDCRLVEHVKAAASQLSFEDQSARFEKVFTKLRVLSLVEFEKVLMLDIDLIVMSNIDDLFELPTPAAMRRGMNDGFFLHGHGDPIDGRPFFQGGDSKGSPWGQGTGINAGAMLLRPDLFELEGMLAEIADPNHPSHIKGSGPEQDYLSRHWASAPWTNISVEYNFQLHQMFFALQPDRASHVERAMILKTPERIKVVHFSGNHETTKPWHRILDSRFAEYWPGREGDAEYADQFAGEFAGYHLWVIKDRTYWDSITSPNKEKNGRLDMDVKNMYLGDDGEIYRRIYGSEEPEHIKVSKDVINGAMNLLQKSLKRWFDTFEDLQHELGIDVAAALKATLISKNAGLSRWRAPANQPAVGSTFGVRRAAQAGAAFKWRREPGSWWVEHDNLGDSSPSRMRVSVSCSAVLGSRFIKFTEAGKSTYEKDDEELTGVFVKVVGSHSGHHFLAGDNSHSDEALSSLKLWAESVPTDEPVLLAFIALEEKVLHRVLDALAPLGAPKQALPAPFQAFAAIGVRDSSRNDASSQEPKNFRWQACHASSDVAYAALPLKISS